MRRWRSWRQAWDDALYGPGGFYRREAPAAHFRTSAHAGAGLAAAVLRLAVEVDRMLDHPAAVDVVDIGAGSGELLAALARAAPAVAPELARRLQFTGVEIRPRPAGLPGAIAWRDDGAPARRAGCAPGTTPTPSWTGLLLAHEWLDDVPVDVVEMTAGGLRLVEVDDRGDERAGDPPGRDDLAWLQRWWPVADIGTRAEVGRSRDQAWAGALSALTAGMAVAIDYAHDRAARSAGRFPFGTLAGYRAGRRVVPVPDGTCDLTAHVALDACATATNGLATATVISRQRAVLTALGVRATRPPYAGDAGTYLRALSAAGEAAELLDPEGLGGFGCLVQTVGIPMPAVLR